MRLLATLLVSACLMCAAHASADKPWLDLKAPRKLAQGESLIIDKADRKSFQREVIRFSYRNGDQVVGYLVKPKVSNRLPVALVLYSYPSAAEDRFLNDAYCERLAEYGIAFFGFESALTGERYRNRPMKEWFVNQLPEAMGTTVHDVQFFIDYVQIRSDLDGSKVGMFGEGSGGTTALLAASVDARIKAVDVQNPWADWRNWLREAGQVPESDRSGLSSAKFLNSVKFVDPISKLKRLRTKLLRVNLVRGDKNAPDSVLKSIESAVPSSAELRKYDTIQSYFRSVSGGRLFGWLAKALTSGS